MNRIKTGINVFILVVVLTGIAGAKSKIPEGFWTAPISYTGYANGFGRDVTPDTIFRKCKFMTMKPEEGIVITSRIIGSSIKGNKITFIIERTENKKPTLRVVTTLVYNKDQQTNYIDSVFIKNYENNAQLKFVNQCSGDELNDYTAGNMGQLVGAFWGIMAKLLDMDELNKLMGEETEQEPEENNPADDSENTPTTE